MRPPICDKTAPPHLENPGSATDLSIYLGVCKKGRYGRKCHSCAYGRYKDFNGNENCKKCAHSYTTSGRRRTDVNQCGKYSCSIYLTWRTTVVLQTYCCSIWLKVCSHVTYACTFAFDAKNGLHGCKWHCVHNGSIAHSLRLCLRHHWRNVKLYTRVEANAYVTREQGNVNTIQC